MRVPAAHDERHGRKLDRRAALLRLQHHGVHVPFDVIDADERNAAREGKRFGVGQAHQQRAHQPGPDGDGDCRKVRVTALRLFERQPHHRHDRAQMLA